jgi:16S rRNA (guanine966-N2)-methyltransferase
LIRLGRGMWKGHILRPSVRLCRPTSSLLRGAFLDIAGRDQIESAVIWDLCAGTGAVGLEALSWGALHCVFVDRNPRATSFIRDFLKEHCAMEYATVITMDAKNYIIRADTSADIIFIDPPYRHSRMYEWIEHVKWCDMLSVDGAVFVEAGSDKSLNDSWTKRKYGDSVLCWKRMKDLQ